jgi:HEPN domain-containing protein
LKALFIKRSEEAPRIHDLFELANGLPSKDKAKLSLDTLSDLNSYAVDVRYPGNMNTPLDLTEAAAAMKIASHVRTVVLAELK